MAKVYDGDLDDLCSEGWERGAYANGPGWCGYYLRHDEHHPDWVCVQTTPCSDDSLTEEDEDGESVYVGPSGECSSATEALLDRIASESPWDDDDHADDPDATDWYPC